MTAYSFFVDGTETRYQARVSILWWQEKGLQYTATGYGSKIPTRYMILDGKRWKRVYCMVYSNAGTCYFLRGKERVIVDDIL